MTIAPYLKEIGRGKQGARSLTRDQAADLFGRVLDGQASELEVGAFCMAMRVKGETPQELAGFCDAAGARMARVPATQRPVVVLPSYNGARRLPVLTPLLALLVAREGLPVLVHGHASEDTRVSTRAVLEHLSLTASPALGALAEASVTYVDTQALLPGLARLLDVRRAIGVRGSAHSVVKLLAPCAGPSLLVTSYTHPEFRDAMRETLCLTGARALLLRGTEGEPVADPRRAVAMTAVRDGQAADVQAAQAGTVTSIPELPACEAASTAQWTARVLAGAEPVPAPIAAQLAQVLDLAATACPNVPRHAAFAA